MVACKFLYSKILLVVTFRSENVTKTSFFEKEKKKNNEFSKVNKAIDKIEIAKIFLKFFNTLTN